MHPTHPITLTKVSDTSVVHNLNVLRSGTPRGQGGALQLELGSAEHESMGSGRRGSIRLESFHQGMGDKVQRKPYGCYFSRGVQVETPGVVKFLPALGSTDLGFQSTAADRGGGYTGDDTEEDIIVVPSALLDAAGSSLASAPSANYLNGNWAFFGDRIFFGVEYPLNRDAPSTGTVVRDIINDTEAAGGNHNFYHTIGSRLFVVQNDWTVNRVSYVKWTDQLSDDTPTFSTAYTLPLNDYMVTDVGSVGPHLLIALGGPVQPGKVVTMDTEGNFTDIVPAGLGFSMPVKFVPYLGGTLLLLAGEPRALWFRSLTDVRSVQLMDLPDLQWPLYIPEASRSGGGAPVAAATAGEVLYLGLPFTNSTYLGSQGAALVMCVPDESGAWSSTVLDVVDGNVSDVHNVALRVREVSGVRQLQWVVFLEDDDHAYRKTLNIWRGMLAPSGSTHTAAFLWTCDNQGETWINKKFTRIRGYFNAAGANMTVKVLLDGSANYGSPYSSHSVTSGQGPFVIDLDAGCIGRSISLIVQVAGAGGKRILELPLEIDYFYVPIQKDLLRIPVVAGKIQNDSGALEMVSRKDLEVILSNLTNAPEPWTITWGDGKSDWTVLPRKLSGKPIEQETYPADDVAVYWLECERVG